MYFHKKYIMYELNELYGLKEPYEPYEPYEPTPTLGHQFHPCQYHRRHHYPEYRI